MKDRTPERRKSGPVEKVTLLIFFTGILLSVTHKLWAYDVWWHLKTGEWIWTHLTIPRTDLYSYTVSDHPWIDLSWGFQLLFYLFYKILGVHGIIFFKVSVVTLTFFLLFRSFYQKIDLCLLLPILTLALLTAHERLVARPEVLSYLFLVAYLLVLEKDRRKPTKWLYGLPLLQLLWVNTHALFILGLLTMGATCLGEILSWLSSGKKETKPFPTRISLILTLSCLITLLNPYGLKGALFPLTLHTRISGEIEIFTFGIGEFARPLAAYDASFTVLFYKTFLLITPLSFLLNHKRFPCSHGILFLVFTYLSLSARRNIAPFSFVSCFILLKNLEDLFHERPPFLEKVLASPLLKKMKPATEGFLLSFALLLPLPFVTNAFYEHEGLNKRFGLGVSEHRYCIQAANFIKKTDFHGNFFNSGLDVGNYLIWHSYPERKVFMDGRLEVYGESFFQELFQLFRIPRLWPEWAEKYQIRFCILDHTIQKQTAFLRWLYQSPDWIPIYLDEQVIILAKRTPENHTLIETYALDLEKDPIPLDATDAVAELRLADFYGRMGVHDKAEALYQKNLLRFPKKAAIYHNLGHLLRRQGKIEEALSAYRKAVTLNAKHHLFPYSLGALYLEMGKEDLAQRSFEKSSRLAPHFGGAHYQLGNLYMKKRRLTKAEKEYQRVNASDVAYLSARNALGILYAEKGEFEKAEKEFQTILKTNPEARERVLNNLKRLRQLKEETTK